MYTRILLFFIILFSASSFAFAEDYHLHSFENDLPQNVQDLVLQGRIKAAELAKEQWYRDTHGWKSVDYGFSISGNNLYITCSNGYPAYYPIDPCKRRDIPRPASCTPPKKPPEIPFCGTTGNLSSEISAGSCLVGTASALTIGAGNPKTYSWSCSGRNWWSTVSCSASFAHPECDVAVSNNSLKTAPITTGSCKYGTVAGFTSSTDATTGKTTYDWTCTKAWGTTASCKAYYKPLTVVTVDNGACEERYSVTDPRNPLRHPPRLPDQCEYSLITNQPRIGMTGGVLRTQDGPTVVALTWAYLQSTNGIAWNCQAPIDGKPRIVCEADPFVNITGTLSWFTLPSTVTQGIGNCRVIFDAPDVCKKKEEWFRTKAFADCDPTITDYRNTKYCDTYVEDACVNIKIEDKYWNPELGYATGKIVSRFLGKGVVNTYFEKYNPGKDTTQYAEWTYTEVDGKYCAKKICTVVDGALCGNGCQDEGTAKCTKKTPCDPTITDKTNPLFCQCTVGDTRPECRGCVNTPTEPNKCGTPNPICIPSAANNYCKPYIHEPPTTVPGCDSPDYTGDPLLCIEKVKACTAHLEVQDGLGNWTTEGDAIMYDEAMRYRIVMDWSDTTCHNGIISVNQVSATGGTLSGSEIWNTDGTFTATVSRNNTTTPLTARWPVVRAVFTQPGGITYGLTARADDFEDIPLTITGERMKWVRIIGAAGSNITSFNLNNAGVIWEDSGANTVNMRNTILKNVGLLTRWVTPGESKSINGVYYAEWDYTYTQLAGMISNWFRTVIVRGNLTIDTTFPRHDSTGAIIWVIVIKKNDGSKGNIIIKNDVTSMRGVLFAEGSFYGETQTFGNVPMAKLILKWSLFSRNTVGGSAEVNNLYISGGATTTDFAAAFLQDLNNVRNAYGCPIWWDACYKNYPDPFIIDYENTLSDPPPGFSI